MITIVYGMNELFLLLEKNPDVLVSVLTVEHSLALNDKINEAFKWGN